MTTLPNDHEPRSIAVRTPARAKRGNLGSVVPMALVYRNGKPRLQRSIRRDGRVTTEYLASGEDALLISKIDALERSRQEADEHEFQAERRMLEVTERPLSDFFTDVEAVIRDALQASGYHQHKREWRKCRG